MYPILFKIGSFQLHSFGVMMVIAFAVAIWLAQIRSSKYGINKSQIGDFSFWVLLSGILGARIAFIVQDLGYYRSHISELLSLQFQGLTSFGGLIFGALAAILWAKKHNVPILNLLDLVAPSFVVGHAIGRIGCLLNGCCFGGACPQDLPWGIHIAGGLTLHHPAQAYDTLMNLLVLGILLWREKSGLYRGQLVGLALVLHGTTRVIYEFWRAGTEAQVDSGQASSTYWGNFPFTQAQAMAAVLIVIGAITFVVCRQRAVSAAAPRLAAE